MQCTDNIYSSPVERGHYLICNAMVTQYCREAGIGRGPYGKVIKKIEGSDQYSANLIAI